MNLPDLRELENRLYFTAEDIASLLRIKSESAQVLCSRYVKRGIFIRLKNNFYVMERNWNRYENDDFFRLANFLQVPSYISCVSALAFYGVTTQVPRSWYESVSLKRSIRYTLHGVTFHYFKMKSPYYFGFVKTGAAFIAQKEKAFVDACHLSAFGEYAADWSAMNMDSLDKVVIEELMKAFPDRTKSYVRNKCKI
ncbi:MAG: type IV toxin-antitoxin system AbiEi family antitoxin domain-containing protein [Syntrophales bacterium]